ncbi:MAG: PQQ-binding-like beta-propeller repeat protein [Rhodospirillaceae bacterium]|nr:PQQ-binding-like beta-propeller repeat protein [Rhodospirillaceae bacterium]MBT3494440.1 PQQ-binding-like beta-propeller repeat protein [Rhodospirillaceae bacterium]MBT3778605.1 PQQ-binding-like beta-propeller repeat protein [Rhodospirillaceae bacterium]MBT3978513.1 PQQ-binding-like beta-propeller repeat protein [Rhodospirillaceae bacterium]MBT4167155.1 PQQ-binding-like beta-propeller repeat protein [Rhodospirillaceae bacterium]
MMRCGRGGLLTALLLTAATLLLSACETPDWFGGTEKPPLPGERISILQLDKALEPDAAIADLDVRLPRPWRNPDWPQAAGFANHAMHHLEIGEDLARAWKISIGEGSGSESKLLSRPVVVGDRLVAMDAEAGVSAFRVADGKRFWHRELTPENEDEGVIGGGVSIDNGTVYVSTGYGFVHALSLDDGKEIWQRRIGTPIRGAPTAIGGRVFVITYDNQLHALSSADGHTLWSHGGIPEDAGLIGAPSVAVGGGLVVVPYSSGELFALRLENGRMVWGDQLIRTRRLAPLSTMSEIRGSPVIDRDLVLAVSFSGRVAAIDLRSGRRLWDRDIAGMETPWVAGDFIFLVTTQAEVVCLARKSGRIRWVAQLPRYEDEEDKQDPIHWSGPVLASDRLVLVSSEGYAVAVSPYSGKLLGRLELPKGALIPPVVADGSIYVLSDNGDLIALR